MRARPSWSCCSPWSLVTALFAWQDDLGDAPTQQHGRELAARACRDRAERARVGNRCACRRRRRRRSGLARCCRLVAPSATVHRRQHRHRDRRHRYRRRHSLQLEALRSAPDKAAALGSHRSRCAKWSRPFRARRLRTPSAQLRLVLEQAAPPSSATLSGSPGVCEERAAAGRPAARGRSRTCWVASSVPALAWRAARRLEQPDRRPDQGRRAHRPGRLHPAAGSAAPRRVRRPAAGAGADARPAAAVDDQQELPAQRAEQHDGRGVRDFARRRDQSRELRRLQAARLRRGGDPRPRHRRGAG